MYIIHGEGKKKKKKKEGKKEKKNKMEKILDRITKKKKGENLGSNYKKKEKKKEKKIASYEIFNAERVWKVRERSHARIKKSIIEKMKNREGT